MWHWSRRSCIPTYHFCVAEWETFFEQESRGSHRLHVADNPTGFLCQKAASPYHRCVRLSAVEYLKGCTAGGCVEHIYVKPPPLPSTFRFVLFSITVNHGNALFLFFRSQMDFVLVWCEAERFCNAAVFYASPRVNSVVKVTIAAIKQSSRSSVHRTTALCYNSCFMWSLLLYLWNLFYFIV